MKKYLQFIRKSETENSHVTGNFNRLKKEKCYMFTQNIRNMIIAFFSLLEMYILGVIQSCNYRSDKSQGFINAIHTGIK